MRLFSRLPGWVGVFVCCTVPLTVFAQESADTNTQASAPSYSPYIAEATAAADLSIRAMQIPPGFRVELFASEPIVANPVAFTIDDQGRFYVAETFRHGAGVTDNRAHMYWLDDDLASRSVEDRVEMYRKHLSADELAAYASQHDRIRMIVDEDRDGRADRSTVFADGFNTLATGIGAGVLARGDQVWYACIPDLWLLTDENGDGHADRRKSLHYGYGVHVGFLGHDLHGLCFGPDGKLYFSIGDRGFNVETDGRTLANIESGTVLRCNPDGSDLEVFATGLRNPQELAFDEFGNLFTVDNNSDSGDKARLVYVVEGGDSGWRIGYQFITAPVSRGPWNAEKLWYPAWPGQAAYIVPPLANLSDGPSGLTYYPGTGLPERYRGHFFLADFRGERGLSGIHSFAVRPQGASFELIDLHRFVWLALPTDVDFGPDGNLYWTDWVGGWNKPNRGRIYRIFDPGSVNDPVVRETAALLASGNQDRSIAELAELLGHADRRVRLNAQFTLASRGQDAIDALSHLARESENRLARLHAIWGLGQIGRKNREGLETMRQLLTDSDPEVRAQSAKLLGEARLKSAYDDLLPMLGDSEERVRFFALMSLGKLGHGDALPAILTLARNARADDAYMRHAVVMALVGVADLEQLLEAADDPSPTVRMAVLLALRRLNRPEVARFLDDPDMLLVVEAARAIYDVPIPGAMPNLAKLIGRLDVPEPAALRAINANLRLGQEQHARALAGYAALGAAPLMMRREALAVLAEWTAPSGRDRVTGLWRPIEPGAGEMVAEALRPHVAAVLADDDARMVQQAAELAGKHKLAIAGAMLRQLLADRDGPVDVRFAALQALERIGDDEMIESVRAATADVDPLLRAGALRLLAQLKPEEALPRLKRVLDENGNTAERQQALATLAEVPIEGAADVLSQWMDRMLIGNVPEELQLDLAEAAARRNDPDIDRKLETYEQSRRKDDPLANYRETLNGGDAKRGRRVYLEKTAVSCVRCHQLGNIGGQVGPSLDGIGSRKDRRYLLEALVEPNRQIAEGFETVIVATEGGRIHTGIVRSEDDQELVITALDGQLLRVPKAEILERTRGASAMPDDLMKHLTKSELRDLVEFLASLQGP